MAACNRFSCLGSVLGPCRLVQSCSSRQFRSVLCRGPVFVETRSEIASHRKWHIRVPLTARIADACVTKQITRDCCVIAPKCFLVHVNASADNVYTITNPTSIFDLMLDASGEIGRSRHFAILRTLISNLAGSWGT